jgi:Kef-type K+ transport system membrane component KefB
LSNVVKLLTMFGLSFIMIHVGYEFELDKSNLKAYGWDYVVAATAFPWIFCLLYFVFVLSPPELWSSWASWKDLMLASRFAAPTSAGVLFRCWSRRGSGRRGCSERPESWRSSTTWTPFC